MSPFKDSSYCAKCKKRLFCHELCAPVEELLKSHTHTEGEKLPPEFVEKFQNNPETWPVRTEDKKIQICELYFEDHMQPLDIALIVGCTNSYVYRIINDVKRAAGVKK